MTKTPEIVAHRGLRDELPENTLASISAALRLPGLAGVEFDVELTDSPVVLHQETVVPDPTFTRLELGTRNFVSRDWVSQKTAAEITTLDAGSWFSPEFSHLKVPRLREVLAAEWGNKVAYVELKDSTYWGARDLTRPVRAVAAVLPELKTFPGSVNIVSFNPEILREVRKQLPELPLTLALWTDLQAKQQEALDTACDVGAGTISLADSMVFDSPDWVMRAHARGLKVHVYPISPARDEPEFSNWTASSQRPKWERLAALNVDGILSDFPRDTLSFFKIS
jgi:glycerophosphoryl diester phosphodiesterase